MLKEISWSNYAQTIGIVLTLYYLFLLITYYRRDLRQIFERIKNKTSKKMRSDSLPQYTLSRQDNRAFQTMSASADVAFSNRNESLVLLTNEIDAFLAAASKQDLSKEQIFISLQWLIRKYTSADTTLPKAFIEEYIVKQCVQFSIQLEPAELKDLWRD